jgi:hypothetical protein
MSANQALAPNFNASLLILERCGTQLREINIDRPVVCKRVAGPA